MSHNFAKYCQMLDFQVAYHTDTFFLAKAKNFQDSFVFTQRLTINYKSSKKIPESACFDFYDKFSENQE